MGRQVLTFVLVFAGIWLLMKTCSAPPAERRGLAVEQPDEIPKDAAVLRHEKSGAEAVLAADGSVVTIAEGENAVMRPVRAGRRPFRVILGQTDRARAIPEAEWTSEDLPEGGRRYVHAKDKLRIENTLRFTEDGHGLVLGIKAEGVPPDAIGLALTGASGVELFGDGSESPFAFSQLT